MALKEEVFMVTRDLAVEYRLPLMSLPEKYLIYT